MLTEKQKKIVHRAIEIMAADNGPRDAAKLRQLLERGLGSDFSELIGMSLLDVLACIDVGMLLKLAEGGD